MVKCKNCKGCFRAGFVFFIGQRKTTEIKFAVKDDKARAPPNPTAYCRITGAWMFVVPPFPSCPLSFCILAHGAPFPSLPITLTA